MLFVVMDLTRDTPCQCTPLGLALAGVWLTTDSFAVRRHSSTQRGKGKTRDRASLNPTRPDWPALGAWQEDERVSGVEEGGANDGRVAVRGDHRHRAAGARRRHHDAADVADEAAAVTCIDFATGA